MSNSEKVCAITIAARQRGKTNLLHFMMTGINLEEWQKAQFEKRGYEVINKEEDK